MPQGRAHAGFVTLRLLALLVVCMPAASVAGVLFWIADRSGARVTEELAAEVLTSTSEQVRLDLDAYIRTAERMGKLAAAHVERGDWDPGRREQWAPGAWRHMLAFPEVASIMLGESDGTAAWVAQSARGPVFAFKSAEEAAVTEYSMDPTTGAVGQATRSYPYDPRQRPWYQTGINATGPGWTGIYTWAGGSGGDRQIGVASARPTQFHGVKGVVAVDITLGDLSQNLATLAAAAYGIVFVWDDSGLMIASSRGSVLDDVGNRVSVIVAAETEGAKFENEVDPLVRGSIEGQPAYVLVTPYRKPNGIDWRVGVAVPEAEFMGSIAATRRHALFVAGVAAVAVLVTSGLLASVLSRHVSRIGGFVRGLSAGDFSARVPEAGPDEWKELARNLNKAAGDLADYVQTRQALAVATEVQQSLLPEGMPQVDGLEVCGKSNYCDTTGGDYFDFIVGERDEGGRLILVVGDVMGHGIGSALLMATARAALRVSATGQTDLAEVMNTVNRVLSNDARNYRFMTMMLLSIDPARRLMRWVSAGHDPVLIVDPRTGEIREPDGGGLPLGIEPEEKYEVHQIDDLVTGSLIFIGTDGIWETRSATRELFGKDRLRAILRENAGCSVQQVGDAVERAVAEFRDLGPQTDDITYVVARLRSSHESDR